MADLAHDRVLLVDDDEALLRSLLRTYRRTFDLTPACGAAAALQLLEREDFAVVVSDYHMPGMNGIEFLRRARDLVPDATRVMLTGQADLHGAIDAVNQGHVFRFLTKPCSAEAFTSGLEAALEQFRLRHAERLLLEQTVRGSIEVLADVLALANPAAFGRATRIRGYVRQMTTSLELPDSWQYETAALLCQIGCVAIPPDVLERVARGEALPRHESRMLETHTQVARELLEKIPRLERIGAMIDCRDGVDSGASGDDVVALGGCLISVARSFDELVSLGATREQAVAALRQNPACTPRIRPALASLRLLGQNAEVKSVGLRELRLGMILDQDVVNENGVCLVPRGNKITAGLLARLRNHAELGGVVEPIRVRLAQSAGADGRGVPAGRRRAS